MSYLFSGALYERINVLRTQSYRLIHKSLHGQQKMCGVPRIGNLPTRVTTTPKVRCTNFCSNSIYGVDTNVTKDIVLFKYENPRFFNVLNIFALCQFIFWSYLSHFAFTKLKDAPVEEKPGVDLKWYQRINLGENKYRNGITIVCFVIGYGVLAAAWLFTLRSVRFLILNKGGRSVSFVTYGPFNKNRIMSVPLKYVSAQESRQAARVQLPIKVKNRSLFYVLDMRGEFRNPQLFDYTAGLKRRLVDA